MHSFDDDKELDLLTKTAAEAIDAPNAANWEKMQRILDKELPLQKKRRGGLIWWFIPAILAAGLGYYWLNPSSKQTINIQTQTSKETLNKIQTTKPIIEPEKTNSLITDKIPNQNKAITLNQVTNTTKFKVSNKVENKKIVQNSTKVMMETSEAKESTTTKTDNNCCVIKEVPGTNKQTIGQDITSQSVDTKSPEKNLSTTNNNSNKIVTIKKDSNKNQGIFIGLIGGFDASTVKFKYASNVGFNIGGTIGYRFNNHWSVQSGAIYTQKNYKLNGQDFHAPKGSWASYHEIETVDGYCKMWDVPIIATYHFTGNNNGNTFVSIGTSSYFMKHENYNYIYDLNNQYYSRSSSLNSSDQHLFALLHISAGIERPISKSITSIIEPYAKIPLTGVGFGTIQLSSFGLNFSIQYRQPKK